MRLVLPTRPRAAFSLGGSSPCVRWHEPVGPGHRPQNPYPSTLFSSAAKYAAYTVRARSKSSARNHSFGAWTRLPGSPNPIVTVSIPSSR